MSQENESTDPISVDDRPYTSADIVHLSDREHVRKRAGMYIGDTHRLGRHHLIEEVLSVMLGCFRAGVVSRISVVLHADNSVSICDDNVTCQLSIDEKFSKFKEQETTNLEREVGSLHNSCGKEFFGAKTHQHGSIHGVTMAVVNFVSERFRVEACGESEVYRLKFEQGLAMTPVETSRRTTEQGTRITFLPDSEIFQGDGQSFDCRRVRDRLEVLAFLNAGLTIDFQDERNSDEASFQFPAGVSEMLNTMTRHQQAGRFLRSPVVIDAQTDEIEFHVALRPAQAVVSFVNETNCYEGGTHLTGFFDAMSSVLNEIGLRDGYLDKNKSVPTTEDYESDLQGVIHVQMKSPQWTGATKTKIANSEFTEFAEEQLRPKLIEFFESNEENAKYLVARAARAAEQRAENQLLN